MISFFQKQEQGAQRICREVLENLVLKKEVPDMKGYVTAGGYMGMVEGRYILFVSEEEYMEYIEEF